MPGREAELSLNEREFVVQALKSEIRVDGRAPFDQRAVTIRFGDSYGSSECTLGDTRVAAQVSAEVVKPRDDRPFEGFLIVSTEVSPMASSVYEMGRSSDEEGVITRLLEKALRRSGAVDLESLCIVAAQKVWSVRVDVHFLDDGGNLVDCASIAAIAALRHFRKAEVTVAGEEVTIHSLEERVPTPLAIHHSPYCITFAFFGDGSLVVLDPVHLEQQVSTGTLTLTLNAQREICVLTKSGGSPMSTDAIMRIITLGVERAKELEALVATSLSADSKARGQALGSY